MNEAVRPAVRFVSVGVLLLVRCLGFLFPPSLGYPVRDLVKKKSWDIVVWATLFGGSGLSVFPALAVLLVLRGPPGPRP